MRRAQISRPCGARECFDRVIAIAETLGAASLGAANLAAANFGAAELISGI
jgi:hypothetical protein